MTDFPTTESADAPAPALVFSSDGADEAVTDEAVVEIAEEQPAVEVSTVEESAVEEFAVDEAGTAEQVAEVEETVTAEVRES